MSRQRWNLGILLASLIVTGPALAVDYDYEAAKRAWERKKERLDTAERILQQEEEDLASKRRVFQGAQSKVDGLENDLADNRSYQRDVEGEIDHKEDSARDAEREKAQLLRANDDLRREIDDLEDDQGDLEDEIEEQAHQLRHLNRRIEELEEQDPEENEEELERLRHERNHVQRELAGNRDDYKDGEDRLDSLQRSLDRNRSQIRRLDDKLADLDEDIRRAKDRLRRLRDRENQLEFALSNARGRLADARSAYNRQQAAVDRAQDERDRAYRTEREAWSYYQEVLDNYNRAYAAAVAKGRNDARADAGREATERAEPSATAAGRQAGTEAGRADGVRAAQEISRVRGYNHGLAQGASDGDLAESYQTGRSQGVALAETTAEAEDYPRGYNDRMNRVLAQPPRQEETYDITDELPDIEPGDGALLDPQPKSIGDVEEPDYTPEGEPAFDPPEADDPNVTAPRPDHRYFDPKCSGQPLQDFVTACNDSYESSYDDLFADLYDEAYDEQYSAAFENASEEAYREARDQQFPDIFAAAAETGARHGGILDGFTETIDNARTEAYAAGEAAFESYRETGYLPLLRSVTLEDEIDDGNLSPGEAVKLTVEFDNYGTSATPGQDLRLSVQDVMGGSFTVSLRALPTLAADTKTILHGVLTGEAAQAAAQAFRFQASLELLPDGAEEPEVLDVARFQHGVRLPVALTRIGFPSPLLLETPGTAQVFVKNQTDNPIAPTRMNLSLDGEGLTTETTELEVPALPPGEEQAIDLMVTATAAAGGNVPSGFTLASDGIAGSGPLTLSASRVVPVDRDGQLALCLPRCTGAVNFPLRVAAGGILRLPTQFTVLGEERATFEFGKLEESDERIRGANGSTVRVGPSQWGPRSQPYTAHFLYRIPRALQGQRHWVSLYLKKGRTTIHEVKVPFVVE